MSKIRNVLIAGGGVGGLAAAISFASRGVDVSLIEKREDFSIPGVGLGQPSNALPSPPWNVTYEPSYSIVPRSEPDVYVPWSIVNPIDMGRNCTWVKPFTSVEPTNEHA